MSPHRIYHTLEHPVEMLRTARLKAWVLSPTQIYAIWFHDVIYRPGALDNEERSVDVARRVYENELAPGSVSRQSIDINRVERIILDTAFPHTTDNEESKAVVDLDLLGFCDGAEGLVNTQRKVYAEFIGSGITFQQWYEGRVKFLETLLNRSPFYYTRLGNDEAAYHNVGTELGIMLRPSYRDSMDYEKVLTALRKEL